MYTVTSFCELAPVLIRNSGRYLLSEVFSQDPVERYFSKQRHWGGGNENPTVEQFQTNAAILMQQQQTCHELKTMNVLPDRRMTYQPGYPLMNPSLRDHGSTNMHYIIMMYTCSCYVVK